MKLDESQADGPHARLAMLAGSWSGTTRTWFEPDVLADESATTGTIRPILGGRFMVHEYAGEVQGKRVEGVAIYGFDLLTNKWQTAWVDTFHMSAGILFSEGDAGEAFRAAGTYFAGEGNPRWGWRTEIDIVDNDNVVISAFNIMPDGQESKATETRYKREA